MGLQVVIPASPSSGVSGMARLQKLLQLLDRHACISEDGA
jgi:hypothetical protein